MEQPMKNRCGNREESTKREVYSRPSRKQGRYKDSKKTKTSLRIKINRAIAVTLTVAVIGDAGAGTKGIITNMVMDHKKAKNAEVAVEIAAEYDKYLNNLEYKFNYGQEVMDSSRYDSEIYELGREEYSKVREQRVEGAKRLTEAIKTYNELRYERNRTVAQESEYVDACRLIASSTDLVVELYSDAIREKVAIAEKITDPYKIYEIKVRAEGSSIDSEPRVTWISTIKVGNSKEKLSKDLQKVVKSARELLDTGKEYDPAKTSFKDAPVDEVIDKYQEAMDFNSNYDITFDKKGNLTLKQREQEKSKVSNNQNKQNDTADMEIE